MNNKQLILAIAFLLINFLGKAQVTEIRFVTPDFDICEGFSSDLEIELSRELLPTETITWSSNGLGDHLQVVSDKMSATLLSSALPGNYRVEVRIDNAENNAFVIDELYFEIIELPKSSFKTYSNQDTIIVLKKQFEFELEDLGGDYNITWSIEDLNYYNNSNASTTLDIYIVDNQYKSKVVGLTESGEYYKLKAKTENIQGCLVTDSLLFFRDERSLARIVYSYPEDELCSSQTMFTELMGSSASFYYDPYIKERYEWIDINGALGTPGAKYTSQSLIFDKYYLPIGEYEFQYSITNNQFPNSPSVDTYILKVNDVPDQPVISGPSEVCEDSEESYSVYPVATATEYTWTVSGSNSIVSGQAGNDVTVAFSTESSSSETSTPVQIEVTANNQCGSSSPATLNVEKSNCSVVGFNSELVENSYKLYPNPFTTSFNLTGIQDFQKVEVYNVSGQLVESYTSKNDLGLTLPKGNYVLKIHTASEIVYKKIMKR